MRHIDENSPVAVHSSMRGGNHRGGWRRGAVFVIGVLLIVSGAEADDTSGEKESDTDTSGTEADDAPDAGEPKTDIQSKPPHEAGGVVLFGDVPPVIIDAATFSGQTRIALRNDTQSEARVPLTAGRIVTAKENTPLDAQISFFDDPSRLDSPLSQISVPAGEVRFLYVKVTGYREPGESTALLIIGDNTYNLEVRFLNVDFNVGPLARTPDFPQLSLVRGKPTWLVLKNEDSITYPIKWRLTLQEGESSEIEKETTISANSTRSIKILPPDGWFSDPFDGLFKSERRTGLLMLTLARPTNTSLGIPMKDIPIQMDLSYWDPRDSWAGVVGNLIILLILLLGVVASMVLSLWIPNYLQRGRLERRIDMLRTETSTILKEADSKLRVGLRLDRLKVQDTLRGLLIPSLGAAAQMKQLSNKLDDLARRVKIAVKMNRIFERLKTPTAPPAFIDEATSSLKKATSLLLKDTPEDGDLQQAEAAIDNAASRLTPSPDDDPAFQQQLANRLTELQKEYDTNTGPTGKTQTCKDLNQEHPGLFLVLDEDPKKITRQKYRDVDLNLRKLEILKRFISQNESKLYETQEWKGRLISQLKPQNNDSLIRAERIVRQIEEGTTVDQLTQALEDGKFEIEHDPASISPNRAIQLGIRFNDNDLNRSLACRDLLTCNWGFVKWVGDESGWSIKHYFRKENEMEIEIGFINHEGVPIEIPEQKRKHTPTLATPSDKKQRLSDTTKAETWKLALTIVIAAIGLIGGVREQFMKLDLFFGLTSIFLLGVGADVIKNKLTNRDS